MTLQIKETVEYDRILEKEYKSTPQETIRNGECRDNKTESTKNANNEGGIKRSDKRGRQASERTQRKRAKKNIGIDSEKVAGENVQEKTCDDEGTSLNLKGKSNKGSKRLCTHASAAEVMLENVSTSAEGPKSLNQGNIPMIADLSASLDEKEGIHGSHPMKKTGKKSRTINRNLTAPKNTIIQSHSNEVPISQSRSEPFPADGGKTVPDLCKKSRESETESIKIPQCDKKLKSSKKVKFSTDDNRNNKSIDKSQSTHKKVAKGSPLVMVPDVRVMEDSSKMEKLLPSLNGILRKCEGVSNKIQCAFCHSTEDSEVSVPFVSHVPFTCLIESIFEFLMMLS